MKPTNAQRFGLGRAHMVSSECGTASARSGESLPAAPVLADYLATSITMRVIVTRDAAEGSGAVGAELIREESRWWPGDTEPELVDVPIGSSTFTAAQFSAAVLAEAIDCWLISTHRLRVLPGSWTGMNTAGTDLDLYLAAVATAAVPVGQQTPAR